MSEKPERKVRLPGFDISDADMRNSMLSFLDLNIPGHVEGHLSSRQLVVLRFALTAASAGRCRLSGGLGGAGLPAAPPPAWF